MQSRQRGTPGILGTPAKVREMSNANFRMAMRRQVRQNSKCKVSGKNEGESISGIYARGRATRHGNPGI